METCTDPLSSVYQIHVKHKRSLLQSKSNPGYQYTTDVMSYRNLCFIFERCTFILMYRVFGSVPLYPMWCPNVPHIGGPLGHLTLGCVFDRISKSLKEWVVLKVPHLRQLYQLSLYICSRSCLIFFNVLCWKTKKKCSNGSPSPLLSVRCTTVHTVAYQVSYSNL